MVLEGKELEGKIGDGGGYSIDVDGKGFVKGQVDYGKVGAKGGAFFELDIVLILEKLVASTENKFDDAALAYVKGLLGR